MLGSRWQLHRAGLLNVWQYDDQVYEFADGRLLLRGTNGAGKSKTLEMLLPFVLDADRGRMDASGRRGSTLSWLMLDGYDDGGSRTGYLWLQLRRRDDEGVEQHLTAGIGLRAASATKTVSLWCFLLPGPPILFEDAAGAPLSQPACRDAVTDAGGEFFDSPRAYKAAIGRTLFGLAEAGYDELLRLLYWLRSPQVGERVEVADLDNTLSESLPELDRAVVEAAATSLDELEELGEQVERRVRASNDVQKALDVYRRYAAGEVRRRAGAAVAAANERASAERAVRRAATALEVGQKGLAEAARRREEAVRSREAANARKHQLETSQEARDLEALEQMRLLVVALKEAEQQARLACEQAANRVESERDRLASATARVTSGRAEVFRAVDPAAARTAGLTFAAALVEELPEALDGLDRDITAALAATELCQEALGQWERARRDQQVAEQRSADAEARAMVTQQELASDEAAEQIELGALTSAVGAWLLRAPIEGRPAEVDLAPVWAQDITSTALQEVHERSGSASARIEELAGRRTILALRRAEVAEERDPAPPAPALPRDEREGTLPLWRVVDLRPDVTASEAAGLEAALQASGLLDALVLPDGRLQGRDTAFVEGPDVEGRSLADVLVPAGDLPAEAVLAALRRVSLEGQGPATMRTDGTWVLGAVEGRADKPAAQYLGAAARETERVRRLAELELQLEDLGAQIGQVTDERDQAVAQSTSLRQWRDEAPRPDQLRVARTRTEAARRAVQIADTERAETSAAAETSRSVTAERLQKLKALAGAHGLPDTQEGLGIRREQLRDLRRDAESARKGLLRQAADEELLSAQTWAFAAAQEEHVARERSSALASREAESQAALYDARHEALSATQLQLQQALAEASEELDLARREEDASHHAELEATKAETSARDALVRETDRSHDAEQQLERVHRSARALLAAPGLLAAVDLEPAEDWPALEKAVRELPTADGNAVHKAFSELIASSAGSLQPRQREAADGLYVLTARDETEGGDLPLAEVGRRLAARVVADQELLTRQHRQVCERHLLGELGEVLRRRRLDAAQLVDHMNHLLADVRTSQGIRVRLDWRLRDDLAEEARGTVKLLERPLGALLPEQRERLLGLLSELVEAGRRDNPDEGYAVHLRNALDYRRWSTFVVRIRRAGKDEEERLTRRTALSQGEQKVVCYLPLFAAAAAHFTSLAAEAPYAPRFILLDDAFPKIDVRTHPVLFGLLVDLDLDWVITSERLWADCDTVPAAAIYEVIRSATERGVLPFKHLWDGRRLSAVGF